MQPHTCTSCDVKEKPNEYGMPENPNAQISKALHAEDLQLVYTVCSLNWCMAMHLIFQSKHVIPMQLHWYRVKTARANLSGLGALWSLHGWCLVGGLHCWEHPCSKVFQWLHQRHQHQLPPPLQYTVTCLWIHRCQSSQCDIDWHWQKTAPSTTVIAHKWWVNSNACRSNTQVPLDAPSTQSCCCYLLSCCMAWD